MEPEMKGDFTKYSPSDPELIDRIVNTIKSKGIFDQFRKDCLADVDTKPAYQNLQRRVNGSVSGFLNSQKWPCAQNKTQLRESVRKHTVKQSFLEAGVDRIVDQVVMPKIYSVFHPKVEEIVYELLGLEKPKPKAKLPKPLLDLKLDFQNFKKSLEASVNKEKEHVRETTPSSGQIEEPQGPTVKLDEEEESQSNHLDVPNTPPRPETNGNAVSHASPEVNASSPASQKSVLEVLNNDDDSDTIDEMPLLAASMDTNSNRATTPVHSAAKNDSNTVVEGSSDSDNNSLPSSHPHMEFDSSTNNLSSMKSDCKVSPTKKFDNFSNLGEKLKQSDVNLRETTSVKPEKIAEESSEVTKSSEHDSESIDLDMEVHSDTSAADSSRYALVKNETLASSHLSDDSMSSAKSKSKSQDSKKDDKIHNQKKISEKSSKPALPEQTTEKFEKDQERSEPNPDGEKKENSKSASKSNDSKHRRSDSSRDKSKSHRNRDDKHRNKDGHSSERNGKHDSGRDNDEKKTEGDIDKRRNKHKDDKLTSDDSDRRKKKEEKSRHPKEEKETKSSKKGEDYHGKSEGKEKDTFKTPEKEKKGDEKSHSDRHKTKSESSSRSSHSKSGDRKSRDDKRHREDDKNDKSDKDDDKKKESRKRKNGKCDENDSKNKNSRRSSDRDSNGNAGGGSDKSKPAGSSQTPKKSSKSEQKTRSRYKDPSNSDAVEYDDPLPVTDEVDLILLQVNSSIENEQHRFDVREILSEHTATQAIKPKIARNFHEIRKIMQARKNINRSAGIDAAVGSSDDHVIEPLPSEADISQNYEQEPSFTDSSADNGVGRYGDTDETTDDSLRKPELKALTVVVTDIMKSFPKSTLNSEMGLSSNVGISVFLGTNDEIVKVEQCVASESMVSEIQTYDDECAPQSCGSKEEVSGKEMPHNAKKTESPTARDVSCAGSNVIAMPQEEMEIAPSLENNATDACVLATSDNEKVTSLLTDSPKVDELVCTATEDDDAVDECSMKSDTSDGSQLSSKDFDERVETSDGESKSSGKPEQLSKQTSADCNQLPSRSTRRKNAGNRMYAILEEVSSSKHSNALSDRGTKRKTPKSRSDFDSEKSENHSLKVASDMGEESSKTSEVPRAKDGTDDGSDVSNKENDETSASGTSRMKNQHVDQSCTVETRSTRRKNPGLDKADESTNISKPDGGRSSGTKPRVSLSSKNANSPETVIEGDDSEKPGVDSASRPHTRRSTSSMSSKVRDSDEEWFFKANPSSSSMASDTIRKSLECLQMEKENLSVLKITASQSSESNSVQTLTPSPRRKSCPDILHPREHCENKDPDLDRCASASEGAPGVDTEVHNNARKTDDSCKSKMAAVKLSKTKDVPQKQFEYYTRNSNNRKKTTCNHKRYQEKGNNNENDKSSCEAISPSEEASFTSQPVSEEIRGGKEADICVVESRDRKPEMKSSGTVNNGERLELEREQDISGLGMTNSRVGKLSKNKIVSSTLTAAENPGEGIMSKKGIDNSSDGTKNTPSNITSSELTRKSTRISKKKSPYSQSEEELSKSSDVKKLRVSKEKGDIAGESERLKEVEKQLSASVSKSNLSNLSERPKREIRRSRRSDFGPCVPPKTKDSPSSNSKVPVQEAAEVPRDLSDDLKPCLETVIDTEVADEGQTATLSIGKPKSKDVKLSKNVLTDEFPDSKENDNANEEMTAKEPVMESGGAELEVSQSDSNNGSAKGKFARLNVLTADFALEDSASSSSLEFRGFSEEDVEPDSDVDCLGFSEGEIQKAATQLRLLTLFIANLHGTHHSEDKKMDVSSEGPERSSNLKKLASQYISKPTRKRKLSLPSSPDKDKKDALIGQFKAESKDSGLCVSPEQTSFASNGVQKSISVDHCTPVNGTRSNPVRTPPASRPERSSKTVTLAKTDIVQTRHSQRYCASDLYKPRPSFARDVRAVKRTASTESSTPGRAKKRSR